MDNVAGQGYAAVGFDVKPPPKSLPDDNTAALGDTIFGVVLASFIRASRHELGLDARPVILAGHSIRHERAVWSAGHVAIPDLLGVVATAPGDRDPYRYADSAIVAAGGRRLWLSIISLAGHSLKRVILARYMVRSAVAWVGEGLLQ